MGLMDRLGEKTTDTGAFVGYYYRHHNADAPYLVKIVPVIGMMKSIEADNIKDAYAGYNQAIITY